MLEILEQVFWWAVLIVSTPCLLAAVVAFPVMCEVQMYKEAAKK